MRRFRKLKSATKIEVLQPLDLQMGNSASSNPEEHATFKLLEISNQTFEINPFQHKQKQEKEIQKPHTTGFQRTEINKSREIHRERRSVAENFTECHKMYRKGCNHLAPYDESIVLFRRNAINPSNFLIFENGCYNNLIISGASQSSANISSEATALHPKTPKKISSLVRRRNISLIRDHFQRQFTKFTHSKGDIPRTGQSKISRSYEIQKQNPYYMPQSPIKITTPIKLQDTSDIEFRCTSANFKKKRYLNFRQLKLMSPSKDAKYQSK